jgi:uncharacterized OsmC-like protein
MSSSDPVVYRSRIKIERQQGPVRLAWLPAETDPVVFGVHSEIAEHYNVPPDMFPSRATTIDYVVAGAAGWLTGTFAGALEARQVDAGNGKLSSEATGEIEMDGDVLLIRRIRVNYKLRAPASVRETIERVHEMHAHYCPVARSLSPGIDITTALELIPE